MSTGARRHRERRVRGHELTETAFRTAFFLLFGLGFFMDFLTSR